MSLTTNSYVRYFKGHRAAVTGIEISPTASDFFVSSGKDDWIRLWDFRMAGSQGCIEEEDCLVAFDPLGVVLAAATTNGIVELFDVRSLDSGPFKRWQLGGLPVDPPYWCSIEFSPNGRSILLSTNATEVYLIDSFSGDRIFEWNDRTNTSRRVIPASFSPNSAHVVTGSTDGNIHIYDTQTGKKSTALAHPSDQETVLSRFHPHLPMLATGGPHLHLWTTLENIPSSNGDSDETVMREAMDI
jgi:COMPASS component SWD2